MIDRLSIEQRKVYTNITPWIKNPTDNTINLLSGAAGTGKTYLVNELLTLIPANYISRTAIAAPTHKAVRILRDMTPTGENCVYGTIHKLLALEQKIDHHGEVSYVNNGKRNKLYRMKYLILDEVSMLSDYIFEQVYSLVNSNKLKVLFVGDEYQIPPIGQQYSIPFTKEYQIEYNFTIHKLSKILRQRDSVGVTSLRNYIIHNLTSPNIPVNRFIDNSTINLSDDIIDLLQQYFTSPDFKVNSDYAKVIAWTNNRVNNYNNIIRQLVYEQYEPPRLMIGEKLIMDSMFPIDENTILLNNDELIVKSLYTTEMDVFEFALSEQVNVYMAEVVRSSDNTYFEIPILHESSIKQFQIICNNIAQEAKREINPTTRLKLWKLYWNTRLNRFANVKYNYAITAHKSQGSTYDYTLIDVGDILSNGNFSNNNQDLSIKIKERNRILYTAMTRFKHKSYII